MRGPFPSHVAVSDSGGSELWDTLQESCGRLGGHCECLRGGRAFWAQSFCCKTKEYTGGCQNYGPLLGPLNTRYRIILRTPKGTIILTTTHTLDLSGGALQPTARLHLSFVPVEEAVLYMGSCMSAKALRVLPGRYPLAGLARSTSPSNPARHIGRLLPCVDKPSLTYLLLYYSLYTCLYIHVYMYDSSYMYEIIYDTQTDTQAHARA